MKYLIRNARILDLVEEHMITGDIAIADGRIQSLGEPPAAFSADHVLEASGMVALPGLVNAHTHLSMSLFRNLADDLKLMDWLQDKIWPLEEKMSGEDVYWGALLSMAELIRSGVTACADMYFSMEHVAQAALDAGLRVNAGLGLTGDRAAAREKLKAFRDFHQEWDGAGEGRIKVDIAPHAPYTCDEGCFEEAAACASDLGCGIHVHLSETADEVRNARSQFGKSPVRMAADAGFFENRTIAAHCVHVDDEDIELLSHPNVHVVHNPSSNLKLASGFAPVQRLLDAGVRVSLGTDGSSSNNNLNIFEEMHLAALLGKAVAADPTALPAGAVLKAASMEGAQALGLEEGAGSLKVGAQADIVLVRLDGLHNAPLHDPFAALVYSAQASDVDSVFVDGKLLMEGRELLTIDEEMVVRKADETFRRLSG